MGAGDLPRPPSNPHQKPRLHHVLKSSGQHILPPQTPPPQTASSRPRGLLRVKLPACSVSRGKNPPPFMAAPNPKTTIDRQSHMFKTHTGYDSPYLNTPVPSHQPTA